MFNPSLKIRPSARRLALVALPCLALVAAGPTSANARGIPSPTSPTPVGSTPPIWTPPIWTPPVGTPPVSTPPVGRPPVGAPPVEAPRLPPQGLYEECAPSNQQQCASELAQMGSAGFRLALNYTAWSGSAADIQAYASAAQAQGIQLIWPMNALAWRSSITPLATAYPQLAASCGGCTTNAAIRQYAIDLVSSLPATWGYYIGDEDYAAAAPSVAGLAQNIRALDPSHSLLYVGQSYPNVVSTLEPFMSSADVLGADIYPIGEGEPVSAVGDAANKVAQITSAAGKQGAMVLQAFSWTEYPTEIAAINPRWPTEGEMHEMLEQAVAANPAMILWYNLADIQRSDNPAQHWQDLVTAAFPPVPTTPTIPAGPTITPPPATTTTTTTTTTTPTTTTPSTPSTTTPSTSSSKTTSTPTRSPKSTPLHGTGPRGRQAARKPAKRSKQRAGHVSQKPGRHKPRRHHA